VAIWSASDTLAASWIKQGDLGGRHFLEGYFMSELQVMAGQAAVLTPQGRPAPAPAPASTPAPAPAPAVPVPRVAEPREVVPLKAKIDPDLMQKQLQEVAEQLSKQMSNRKLDLSFSVDRRASQVVVVVKHPSTGEVLKQIPGEAALRIAHSISDLKGILYDKKIL
jgi:flagellar protein FlaG